MAMLLAAAMALFVAVVYGFGPDNDVFRSYDVREIFLYQKAYYRTALLGGRLPLWTPHTFSGWPFAANPLTQTFYPPALLVLAFTPATYAAVDVAFHLTIAALAMALLLGGTFGLGIGAAAFGGLVYACSGPMVAHAYAGHVPYYAALAYVPSIFFAVDRAAGGDSIAMRWVALAALLVALQILSGGVPFVWLTVIALALYRAGDLLCRATRRRGAWLREVLVLGLVVTAGSGLAAVQLLPSAELARSSNRLGAPWEYAAEGSLPFGALAALAFPTAGQDAKPFWEIYGYCGALPLLLALAGALRVRSERRILILLGIAAVALLFALGANAFLFPLLWSYVPGFGLFREPSRSLAFFALALAALAAIGLDAFAGARAGRRDRRSGILIGLACALAFTDVVVAARANRHRLHMAETEALPRGVHPSFAAVLERDRSWYRYWFPRAFFRENHAYALGARSVGGYDNLQLARYERFVHHMTDTPVDPSLMTILDPRMFLNTRTRFPLRALGVKYVFAPSDSSLRKETRPIARGWFVTRACRVADERAALERMHDAAFDPLREVVFEAPEADALSVDEASCAADDAPAVEVRVAEDSPERLRIALGPHPAGFVVLSEIFYPGWEAHAGDRPMPIHRADSILRAIRVEPDDTEIAMEFRPATLRWGGAISLATLLALAVAVVRRRDR